MRYNLDSKLYLTSNLVCRCKFRNIIRVRELYSTSNLFCHHKLNIIRFFRLYSSSGLFGQRQFLAEISFCHYITSAIVSLWPTPNFSKISFAGANGILCFRMPIFSLRCPSRNNAAVPNKFSGLFCQMQTFDIIYF